MDLNNITYPPALPGDTKENNRERYIDMRKKQLHIIGAVAVALALVVCIAVIAVNNHRNSADPLVSVSYIEKTLTPALQSKFDAQLKTSQEELQASFVGAVSENGGGFTSVTMTSGQSLTCSAGSEILLVSGSAQAINPGTLSDVTGGSSMDAGADLQANHLYIVSSAGLAVTAADDVTVMVRGTATVGK